MDTLISSAKKAYATKDYEQAVELFGDACASYAEKHGEESPDLLYEYGNSLFQVAVANSTLLNSEAVDQNKLPVEQPEQENQDFSFAPEADEEEEEEEEKAEEEDQEEEGRVEGAEPSAEDDATNEGDEDQEGPAAEEEEEEESDFEAAWRILDLCRVLFEKQLPDGGRDIELKLANTYALLGEIAIEDDNYAQAAEDFESALQLKEKLHDKESKELSEANYMLGLACEFKAESAEDSEKALKHLKVALDIAKKVKTDEKTIQELEQKVHDFEQEIKASKENRDAVATAASNLIGRDAMAGAIDKMLSGATDISTLARKKKAPKRAAPTTDKDTPKKPKTDSDK